MIDYIKDKNGNKYSVICTFEYEQKKYVIFTDYKENNNNIEVQYGEYINDLISPIEDKNAIKMAKSIIEEIINNK